MTRNDEIAHQFEEIADRLRLTGESWFKVRAYVRAAERFRAYDGDLVELVERGELGSLPDVGTAITEKTSAYVATGHIPLLERLRGETDDGDLALLRLGLSAAQVREVGDTLGAGSPEALATAFAARGAELSARTRSAVRDALARADVGQPTDPVK